MRLILATRSLQVTAQSAQLENSVHSKTSYLRPALTDGLLILVKLTARDVHLAKIAWIRQADITQTANQEPTTTGLTNTVPVLFMMVLARR
jgi:hypothetical protein